MKQSLLKVAIKTNLSLKSPPIYNEAQKEKKRSKSTMFALLTLTLASFSISQPIQAQEKSDLKNGEYMFTVAGCGSCHGKDGDPKKLSGGYQIKTEFGTFVTPNISPDLTHGIGKWTKADFYAALKEGVSPKGDHYYPSFPYASYAGMSRKDIFDIFSYIKTLPAVATASISHNLAFPYSLRNSIGLWKIAAALPSQFIPQAGKDAQYNRGKYLVEHVAHCAECHTPRSSLFQTLDQSRSFEGSVLNGVSVPGITASKLKRKGLDTFLTSMTQGKTLRGKPMTDKGMLKVVKNMGKLSKEDITAIYSYLANTKAEKTELNIQPVAYTEEPVVASTDNVLTNTNEEFFSKYCSSCHGSGGKEAAKKDFIWSNLNTLASDPTLVTPGKPEKSDVFLSIVDGTMPKHGERPTKEEVATLAQWIKDLKPQEKKAKLIKVGSDGEEEEGDAKKEAVELDDRPFLEEEAMQKAILSDLVNVSEFDRKTTRYISLTHLYNAAPAKATNEQVNASQNYYRLAVAKLINSVSYSPKLHKPTIVEGTNGTVIRINIADLNWDEHKWAEVENLYPYSVIGIKGDALSQIQHITHTKAPIVKGDWFAFTASRAPLYNKLLHLPNTLTELETQIGIDANRNIDKGDVIRAAFTQGHSNVSDHNRLIERHDLPTGGYYWKSYDFGGSDGERSLLQHPFGPVGVRNLPDHAEPFVHDGGEVFFSLPNGLQAYYLADGKDKFIPSGPTDVVRDHTRPPGLGVEVVNAASCMSCHADGIVFKRDELRAFAENSSSFTVNQMKFLKELYPGKETLRKYYKKDQKTFTDALLQLGIGRRLEDGRFENVSVLVEGAYAPREIIGYLADQYQDVLNHQRVAAEFGQTIDQFNKRIESIPSKYNDALRQGLRVRDLLNNGQKLQRLQYEQLFPQLAIGLLGLESAFHPVTEVAHKDGKDKHIEKVKKVKFTPVTLTAKDRHEKKTKRLNLVVKVEKNQFYFGELLKFSVSTSKTCELNIIYKQADGSIVTLPPTLSGEAVLGNPILKAGEVRHLPVSSKVKLRFAEPAGSEELFVQCRAGGLGTHKVDEKKIEHIKKEFTQEYATRGLRIEIDKHAEPEREVHDATSIKFHVSAK